MWRKFTNVSLIAVVCSITCAGQQMQAPEPVGNPVAVNQAPSIRVGVGDQIDMTVFNVPEMTQRQRVDENGNYAVPLIGMVHVAGLSVQQAQSFIATKLEEGEYVRGASVSLFISDFATQGVSVMGEVTKPGVYPVWGEPHLLDLIAAAGGVTQKAGKYATVTHRDRSAAAQTYDFGKGDARALETNPLIAPGDTVVVAKAGIVYVLGEVGRPGGFPLDSKGSLSLLQVIALAQGTTRTAKTGAARLIRKTPNGRSEIAVNLKDVVKGHAVDLRLEDDDIVYIPNSVAKTLADRTLPQIVAATTTAAVYTGLR